MDGIAQRQDERATGSDVAAPRVVISLLGGFRVTIDGHEVPQAAWKRRKARSVVKLLALAPRQTLHREELLEQLWPDLDGDAAASNLRLLLHFARSALRSVSNESFDLIHLRDEHLSLRPPDQGTLEIDVERFRSAAAVAHRTGDTTTLQAAVNLYTGDLLPEDRYDDWAAAPREVLRETWLGLLLALAEAHESEGACDAALAAFERVVSADETHEDAQAGLIRVYARTGRTGQALRQYARFRDTLRRELDIEPSAATQQLHADVAAGRIAVVPSRPHGADEAVTPASVSRPRHNLPEPLASFIGRQRELDDLQRIAQANRLVSLVGTGGAGKSRLALEFGRRLVDASDDGVWLVELASLADPTSVADAVAAVVGVTGQPGMPVLETLANELRSKAMVLLLDNCEHLIDACARLVETLLAACPQLRIITTSREALRVPGEVVWQVPSLALPSSRWSASSLDELAQVPAVELFVSRVRWVRPDYALTSEDADAIVQICHRLDGLPLALELAAARASVLSPAQLAARLDDALGVLSAGSRTAPARHRTLQAALDWSYALLDAQEQMLLRRLSIFAGGWTLDAAESVCAGSSADTTDDRAPIEQSEVLPLLAQLIDKSLVQVDNRSTPSAGSAEVRYRLLQTVHQYAAARLAATDEAARVGEQHAAYFLTYAETAQPMLTGPDQAIWLNRIDRDYDNLRAAFRWFKTAGDIASEARLCFALLRFWYYHGHLIEGNRLLDDLLPRIDDPAVPQLVQGKILQGAAVLAWNQGDLQRSTRFSHRALAIFEQVGDRRGISDANQTLGVVAEMQGAYNEATARYQVALQMREQLGDEAGTAVILHNLGNMAREQREPHRAADLYERSLAIQRSVGNTRGIALALASLAVVALDQGDYAEAADFSTQAIDLYQQVGAQTLRVTATNNLGYALQFLGDLERAAAVQADCLRLAAEIGDKRGIAYGLEGAASAFAMFDVNRRGPEQAARTFGAADALREAIRVPLPPADQAINATAIDTARARLGKDAYQAAWLMGRALPLEDAIAETLALADSLATGVAALADEVATVHLLSPREREVALLVAAGKTNRQIASELGMANRTVDTHVRNLLRKLKLSSRTDVAAWSVSNGLLTDDASSD